MRRQATMPRIFALNCMLKSSSASDEGGHA